MGDILIAIGVGVVIIIVIIVTMLVISGGESGVVEAAAGDALGGAYKYRIIQIREREILIIWHSRRTGLAAVELK